MARLDLTARKKLPASDFALPGQGKGPSGKGSGSYPINTPNRGRNALARVSQFGSSQQKAEVRAKVKQKYPSIGQGVKGAIQSKKLV